MLDHTHVKGHAVSGAKWIGLSTLVTSAFQYLQVIILARFLLPADFGLMAMAMVVIGVAQAFTDMGVSNAVIQRKETASEQLSTLYWLEVLAGLVLFTVMVLLTPAVVQFFGEPRLSEVMIAASAIFLVTPPGQLYQILLQKELQFKTMSLVEISSSFLSAIATIALAYFGFGVMALVFGQIAYYGLRSMEYLIIGLRGWKPRLHFRTGDLKGYISFGLYQVGERIVTYLSINVINLIIGRYLGASALGNYSIAYQKIIYPILRANSVIMTVSFPVFSKYQDMDNLLQNGYLHMTRFISFLTFPVLVVIAMTAHVFVPVLLGPGWDEVIPLIQILCLVGLFKSLGSTTVPTYLAKGRADVGFTWNFVVAIINAIVFYLLTGYGIVTLTLAFAAISLLQFVVLQTITGKMIGLAWRTYLKELTFDSVTSILVAAASFGTYLAGIWLHIGNLYLLGAMIAVSVLVYLLLLLTFRREYLLELRDILLPAKQA